jgi:hypothetical protein
MVEIDIPEQRLRRATWSSLIPRRQAASGNIGSATFKRRLLNRCVYKALLTATVFLTVFFIQAAVAQTVTQRIIGTWVSIKGPADFDSMEFAAENGERIFRSWMHDRPAMFGHWNSDGRTINAESTGDLRMQWSVISVSKNKLVLREKGEQQKSVFRRMKAERRKRT